MKVGKLPQEANQHSRLNEERIKTLTGGDEVTARFLHKEFFTFRPTVKLVLAVNHKPVIQDDSFGMWRRVRVIPFTQQFRIDKTLETTLVDEADLVDGLGRLGSSGHTLGTLSPPVELTLKPVLAVAQSV